MYDRQFVLKDLNISVLTNVPSLFNDVIDVFYHPIFEMTAGFENNHIPSDKSITISAFYYANVLIRRRCTYTYLLTGE
jgi:hypothetical protein